MFLFIHDKYMIKEMLFQTSNDSTFNLIVSQKLPKLSMYHSLQPWGCTYITNRVLLKEAFNIALVH